MSIREKIRIIVENYDTYDCENRTCPKDIDDCDVCISDRILATIIEVLPTNEDVFKKMPKEWYIGAKKIRKLNRSMPEIIARFTAVEIRDMFLKSLND